MVRGKLIVIEGIDGSGKKTQSMALDGFLRHCGKDSSLIHFPCYSETFFGKEVSHYLNGFYGGLENVHPRLAAMLYAGDRFEKKDFLLDKLEKGTSVICDRYVPSNIAHHAARLPTSERSEFREWIEHLEYTVYRLPRPDLVVLLDMPPGIAGSLVLKKEERDYTKKKQDLHEEDQEYLNGVYNLFCDLSVEKGWVRIPCSDGDKVREISDISDDIRRAITDFGILESK